MSGERDLLATIPGGRLLERLLALLIAADRREEFVGDLVEQAQRDHAGRPPLRIGLWLWGQTLHSAPALMSLRLRRLARRGLSLPHGRGAHPIPVGARAVARSWPVPVAVSVTLHAVALATVAVFTLGAVEEVRPPWVPVVIGRAVLPLGDSALETPSPRESEPSAPPAARPQRRSRPATKVAPAAPPVAMDGDTFVATSEDDYDDYPADVVVVTLPPLVGEKRCLSCPKPRLPPAYVRLGAEQQILVKTCVAATGDVTSVDVLRGLGGGADAGVVDTVRSWRFSPHAVGDHPVPFCYPTRFVFAMN